MWQFLDIVKVKKQLGSTKLVFRQFCNKTLFEKTLKNSNEPKITLFDNIKEKYEKLVISF